MYADKQPSGSHPVIQNTKNDFNGFADSMKRNKDVDAQDPQPLSHFHKTFYDLLTVSSSQYS